jgi:transcriptional repressor NrdR
MLWTKLLTSLAFLWTTCPLLGETGVWGGRKGGSMNCPYCGNLETRVMDSRDSEGQEAIRRRRECEGCGRRFTTYEKVEEIPIWVMKRNGALEPFQPEKLLRGLVRACTKRDVPLSRLEKVVEDIEADLRANLLYEVTSERLGGMVLEQLQDVDPVAYVRFASVYRQFESLEEFQNELERLTKEGIR